MRSTADTNLAGYLQAKGYELLAVTCDDGRRAIFNFRGDPDLLDQDISNFYAHHTSVDALKYAQALKNLKGEARVAVARNQSTRWTNDQRYSGRR